MFMGFQAFSEFLAGRYVLIAGFVIGGWLFLAPDMVSEEHRTPQNSPLEVLGCTFYNCKFDERAGVGFMLVFGCYMCDCM